MNPHVSKPKIDRLVNVPDHFIKELLTDSEIRMVKQRLLVINLLEEGLSIRKIASQVKVGTDTVVRVARMLEKKSLRQLVDKERGLGHEIKIKTPWIFGKSD